MTAIPQVDGAVVGAKKRGMRRWGSVGAMSVASVSDGAESGLINTLFPVIQQSLGLGLGALGELTSISRFGRMLFGPLWSLVADRYGRKNVLFIVTGLWGLWTAAAGFAQDYMQLLILYGIGVIGTVASEPISNGLLADLFEEDERGKAYGAIRTFSVFGSLFVTPVIGQLGNITDGWRYGMFIMGGISLLSGILILLFVEEPKKKTASEAEELAAFKVADIVTLVRIPSFLLLAGMLPFVTSLVLFAFFVTYFVNVRGWETAGAAILYTTFMAGFSISSFIGGALGDYLDRKFGPNGRIALMQVYLVVFSFFSYLGLQIDWGFGPAVYVVTFLFGLIGSIGFSGVVLPMVSAIAPKELSATAFALLFSLVQGFLSAVLSLALGYLAQTYGLQNVLFWMVTVPYAVNAVYWFLFYPFYGRDVARQQARNAEKA
jgi:MFS family permease